MQAAAVAIHRAIVKDRSLALLTVTTMVLVSNVTVVLPATVQIIVAV